MRSRALSLCGLVMTVCTGCLLYTDPINMAPEVTLMGPASVQRGAQVAFTAVVTDEGVSSDQGVTFAWAKAPTCPSRLIEEQPNFSIRAALTARTEVRHGGKDARYCLWVVAQDRHGAKGAAALEVEVQSWTLTLVPPARVNPNETATFTASPKGQIPTDKPFVFEWWKSAQCPPSGETPPVADALTTCRGPECGIKPQDTSAFCVTVKAKDAFGIEEVAQLPVRSLENRAPEARAEALTDSMAVATTFELFNVVRLSAARSTDADGDKLTATWSVKRPDGKDAVLTACPGTMLSSAIDAPVCVQVDQAGAYTVQLTVSDGAKMASAAPLILNVEDRPPCFAQTSPDYASAPKIFSTDAEPTFAVTVDDDGDPVPEPADRRRMGRITWRVGRKGEVLENVGLDQAQFTLIREYGFRPGDDVLVRVEYVDRAGDRAAAQTCAPGAYTCAVGMDRPSCLQRLTWEVYLR